MPSREQLGEVLLGSLQDVGTLLNHAYAVAIEEQKALVANDPEALIQTSKTQEDILYRIGEADQRAADAATQLAQMAGLDADSAESSAIAEAAGQPYGAVIINQMAEISKLSTRVREANEINQHLLSNGLEIVACCLRTIAGDTGPNAYSQKAEMAGPHPYVLSLDRRA